MRKALAATAGAALLVVGLATPAAADPKKGETFVLQCDHGLGEVTVVTKGNGAFTPGHVRGSTRMLIPYAFDLSGSFTPTGETEPAETFHDVFGKRGPAHGRTASCGLHAVFTDPYGTAVVDGTVWVAYTPSR